ncbi:hypothetical protein NDU88_005190 [Pleurodeles waltl]|uniref:Uncharacterized protein n=1 Tax=Pleurodeles waltl TaxID=8319 RepID=A0AAV7V3D0_PLEWA|nr:hypothetical protein NDU88_005190 [Pleurodeles waltl]
MSERSPTRHGQLMSRVPTQSTRPMSHKSLSKYGHSTSRKPTTSAAGSLLTNPTTQNMSTAQDLMPRQPTSTPPAEVPISTLGEGRHQV